MSTRVGITVAIVIGLCQTSTIFANPTMNLIKGGTQANGNLDVNGNWVWKVQITPDLTLVPDATGTPVTAELGFTSLNRNLLSATNPLPAGNFDTLTPGKVIFPIWQNAGNGLLDAASDDRPTGIQTNCPSGTCSNQSYTTPSSLGTDSSVVGSANQVFAAQGSINFTVAGAKDYLQIIVAGPTSSALTTSIQVSGVYGTGSSNGRIVQVTGLSGSTYVTTHFDTFSGLFERTAIAGDANLDGVANVTDYNTWLANAGTSGSIPWYSGDFNDDEVVNSADLNILLAAASHTGDFNFNGIVDAGDYVTWRNGLGTIFSPGDYDIWRAHYGQTSGSGVALGTAVPEPTTAVMFLMGAVAMIPRRRVEAQRPRTGRVISLRGAHLHLLRHLLYTIGVILRRPKLVAAVLSLFLVGISTHRAQAQLCVQLNSTTYTQNFNTLAVSGTSNNSSTIPIGFAFSESGTGNNVTYAAADGSSSTPNTYSFGTGTNTERALGEVTGALQSTVGACFVNNTGSAIMTFTVGYTGEQWRLGDAASPVDKLDFQYSTTASALNSGTYTDVNDLDFSSPNNNAASVGPLNGNSAANRTVFDPFAITPTTPIAANATFFIRWLPLNAAGNNDGLGIDDFLLGFIAPPGLSGDFNSDSEVDADDYVIWRKLFNTAGPLPNDAGISPGIVNAADFTHWRHRFGISAIPFSGSGSGSDVDSSLVPEPSAALLLLAGTCFVRLATSRNRIIARE